MFTKIKASRKLRLQAKHRKGWVAALRSGKYEQARTGYLRTGNHFCCLGVGAEESGLGEWTKGLTTGIDVYSIGDEGACSVLSTSLRDHYGISNATGSFPSSTGNSLGNSLVEMNDGQGLSFAEIADVIESEPEGLVAKGRPRRSLFARVTGGSK